MIGVDPDTFTLGELSVMAEECEVSRWNHTASIHATIANVNRDPKKRKRPYRMEDFHPYAEKKVPQKIKGKFEWFTAIVNEKKIPRDMLEAMIDAGHDLNPAR